MSKFDIKQCVTDKNNVLRLVSMLNDRLINALDVPLLSSSKLANFRRNNTHLYHFVNICPSNRMHLTLESF